MKLLNRIGCSAVGPAFAGLIAVAAVLGSTGAASAVTCPSTSSAAPITISTPGATCGAAGNGTINSNDPAFSAYTFIDMTGNTTGAVDGALTITTGLFNGTFSIASLPGFSSFVLVLGAATASPKPDWVSFLLPGSVTNNTWSIDNGSERLQRALLYGVAAVPLPAGLALLGSALAGLGLLGWQRRKSMA